MTTPAGINLQLTGINWRLTGIDSGESNQIYKKFTDGEAAIFDKFGELSDNYPATTRVAMCVTHFALRRITKFVLFASIAENTLKGCYNLYRLDSELPLELYRLKCDLAVEQILLRNGECILNIFIDPFLSLGRLPFIVLKPSFFETSSLRNGEHVFKSPVKIISQVFSKQIKIISQVFGPFFSQVAQTYDDMFRALVIATLRRFDG